MINILIVEDDQNKLRKVLELINNEIDIPLKFISTATNVKEAKIKIRATTYDLMILDLVLPLDSDDGISPENGISFLKTIQSNPTLNPPIHIVGLTSFSEFQEKYSEEFAKYLWHLIEYKADESDWQEKLKNILFHLIKVRKEFLSNNGYDYDIAIITAINKELSQVKKLNADWSTFNVDNDATVYHKGIFSDEVKKLKVVAACAPQMGMNAAATLSMKLIYNFRPRYLIMVGIAACIKKDMEHGYGDIIVADQSWDGGAGKISEDKDGNPTFSPSANYLPLDSDIKEKMMSYIGNTVLNQIREKSTLNKPNTILQLHIGPVASVAGVTENRAVVDELHKHQRKIIGLEMETYGVFYSANYCSNPKPKVISIKSISDFANTEKNDLYQEYASYTSAEFMYHFALNEL